MMGARVGRVVVAHVIAVTAAVATAVTVAHAGGLEVGGYYKNFSSALRLPAVLRSAVPGGDETLAAMSNRIRIDARLGFGNAVVLELSYNLAPRLQDRALYDADFSLAAIDPFTYRIDDLNARPYPSGDVERFALFQNLDRASVTVRPSWGDVILGRQAIAWGSARAVNPTDVIAPFAYNELDTEDRIGVDAARLRVPLGALSELDAGYVFGADAKFARSAFFLRGRTYVAATDVALLAVGFRENLLAGVDLARSVGGASAWLEGGYVWTGALADGGERGGDDYFRATAGFDHSLGESHYYFVEYHYNQAGASDPDGYLAAARTAAFTDGAVYLLGTHYLAPGVVFQVTPLVTLTAAGLVNLTDASVLLAPSVEYGVSDNVYLGAGAYAGLGDAPGVDLEAVGAADPADSIAALRIDSEFGSYADVWFVSLRYYF